METVKVKLEIKRTSSKGGMIEKIIEVEKQASNTKTRRFAELKYCNEYLNRDAKIANYRVLSDAKSFARLEISSKIV